MSPSLALPACALWEGKPLLCCPGGLGSTELTHQEEQRPQLPQCQITTWAGQEPGLPGWLVEMDGLAGSRPALLDLPERARAEHSPPSLAEPGHGGSALG